MKLHRNSTTALLMDRGSHTTATINLHGGNVVSWKINDQEQIFVSRKAIFDGRMAIRGGIPIFFPNVGNWTLGPRHGFARITPWEVAEPPHRLPEGDVETKLRLVDSTFTRSIWNFQFEFLYTVVLCEKELVINVSIENLSKCSIRFNVCLHTYFKIDDPTICSLSNVEDVNFRKNMTRYSLTKITEPKLQFSKSIDGILCQTPSEMTLWNNRKNGHISIKKSNFPDIIVFRPSSNVIYEDMDADEFLKLICVGVGRIANKIKLLPKEVFKASVVFASNRGDNDNTNTE